MPAKANLEAIIEALESTMGSDDWRAFYDPETGEVHEVSLPLISAAEDGIEGLDVPKWQEPEWELAKRIAASPRMLRLPRQFDLDEWEIMSEFSSSVNKNSVREELLDAIHGRGAFRSFKSAIRRHHIEQDWFDFRDQALRDIAESGAKSTAFPSNDAEPVTSSVRR